MNMEQLVSNQRDASTATRIVRSHVEVDAATDRDRIRGTSNIERQALSNADAVQIDVWVHGLEEAPQTDVEFQLADVGPPVEHPALPTME